MGDAQLQSDESRTTAYLDSLSGYNVNPLWTVMEAAVRIVRLIILRELSDQV